MKKTLLLLAALACASCVVEEEQIWGCMQEKGTMLNWRNEGWEQSLIPPEGLLLAIDGANSRVSDFREENIKLSCSEIEYFPEISCLDLTKELHFLINPDNGRLGVSSLAGATTDERQYSVALEIFKCTKL